MYNVCSLVFPDLVILIRRPTLGCGIVGLFVAAFAPVRCRCLLTDLPDAMEILSFNIRQARPAPGSSLDKAVLDWDQDLPGDVQQQKVDLVIVSDCTYNCDSVPALVKTLAAVVHRSPEALIVVSMKVRHSSEMIFFERMFNVGLIQIEHATVELPDSLQVMDGGAPRNIDIYVFCRRSLTVSSNLEPSAVSLRRDRKAVYPAKVAS